MDRLQPPFLRQGIKPGLKVMGKKENIKLMYIGKSTFGPKWDACYHRHAHLEILGLTGGKFTLKCGGKTANINSPAVIIYNKGELHRERVDTGTIELIYSGIILNNSGEYFKQGRPIVISECKKAKAALEYLGEALRECGRKEFGWEESAIGCISRLFRAVFTASGGLLKEERPAGSGRGKLIAKQVKEYIEKNYRRKVGLKEIAETVYLNPYYLAHIFKAETGYSPVQYVIRVKIDKAKELLKDPKLTVSEIAFAVGYESIYHFNRIFSALEGLPPGAFRRKYLKAK